MYMDNYELSDTREDFAVVEKSCEEAQVKVVKGKAKEINIYVSGIKDYHLDTNFDLFRKMKDIGK